MPKKWIPLESNPDVLNQFSSQLGLEVSNYTFHDIFGLDPDLLAMVPKPVLAVIMCFPITKEVDALAKEEDEKLAASGQKVSEQLFYMKQTIGNACGTIALLHSIGNVRDKVSLAPGSFLQQFYEATSGMDPAARGKYLEEPPEGAPDIEAAHQAAASVGDTAPPSEEEEVDLHFIAFVCKDGSLYELDGRRRGPVVHGPSSEETLLEDAAKVVQRFIERSSSVNFNLIALAAAGDM